MSNHRPHFSVTVLTYNATLTMQPGKWQDEHRPLVG
jgi:hypothetical protein